MNNQRYVLLSKVDAHFYIYIYIYLYSKNTIKLHVLKRNIHTYPNLYIIYIYILVYMYIYKYINNSSCVT